MTLFPFLTAHFPPLARGSAFDRCPMPSCFSWYDASAYRLPLGAVGPHPYGKAIVLVSALGAAASFFIGGNAAKYAGVF